MGPCFRKFSSRRIGLRLNSHANVDPTAYQNMITLSQGGSVQSPRLRIFCPGLGDDPLWVAKQNSGGAGMLSHDNVGVKLFFLILVLLRVLLTTRDAPTAAARSMQRSQARWSGEFTLSHVRLAGFQQWETSSEGHPHVELAESWSSNLRRHCGGLDDFHLSNGNYLIHRILFLRMRHMQETDSFHCIGRVLLP